MAHFQLAQQNKFRIGLSAMPFPMSARDIVGKILTEHLFISHAHRSFAASAPQSDTSRPHPSGYRARAMPARHADADAQRGVRTLLGGLHERQRLRGARLYVHAAGTGPVVGSGRVRDESVS